MKYLFVSIMFMLTTQAHALDEEQSTQLGKLFDEAGVKGTFVLYDVSADRRVVHNLPRAEKRPIPASTFKTAT